MPKIKQDLFQLIKSLDRNEKGYFKKYTQLHSSNQKNSNGYIRLFDAIDAMDEYDETILKKKFANEKFIRQLFVMKNYLYNSILKSLRNYSSESTDNLKILTNIKNTEILIRKGQYEKALEYIHSTKQYALKREFWGYVNELIEMERSIYNIHRKANAFESVAQLNREKREVMDMLKNDIDYTDLSYKFTSISYKYRNIIPAEGLKQIKKYGTSGLLMKEDNAKSIYTKGMYSSLKGLYLSIVGKQDKIYPEAFKSFELLKNNPFAIQKYPASYFTKANNLGTTLVRSKRYDELKELLNEVSGFEHLYKYRLNSKLKGLQFSFISRFQLVYFSNTFQFENGVKYLKSIKNDFELFKKDISADALNSFHFYSVNLYILSNRYRDAISCLNEILVFNKSTFFQDLNSIAKYVLLIMHYELESKKMFNYVNSLFKTDESIEPLDFLKARLPSVQNKKEEKEVFIEFKKRLLASKNRKMIRAIFDFESWAESKIQNKPFAKIVQSN